MVYFPKCLFIRICLTRSTKARTANSTVFTSTRTPSFELKRCSFRSPSSYPRVSSRYFFLKKNRESNQVGKRKRKKIVSIPDSLSYTLLEDKSLIYI